MRKLVLVMAVTFGGTLSVMPPQAEAGVPFIFPGSIQTNGPRPFSTVRSRELQAARNQRLSPSSWFQPAAPLRVYSTPVTRSRTQWPGGVGGPRPGAFFFRGSKGFR